MSVGKETCKSECCETQISTLSSIAMKPHQEFNTEILSVEIPNRQTLQTELI